MTSAIPPRLPVFIINDGKTRKEYEYTSLGDVRANLQGRRFMAIRTETKRGVEIEIRVGTAWEVFTAYISRSLSGIGEQQFYYRKSAIDSLMQNEVNAARKAMGIGGQLVYSAPKQPLLPVNEEKERASEKEEKEKVSSAPSSSSAPPPPTSAPPLSSTPQPPISRKDEKTRASSAPQPAKARASSIDDVVKMKRKVDEKRAELVAVSRRIAASYKEIGQEIGQPGRRDLKAIKDELQGLEVDRAKLQVELDKLLQEIPGVRFRSQSRRTK